MPSHESIAELLRREILTAPVTLNQLAKTLGLNQPSLWRFVNEGVDPKLASAELLLRHFGYVVAKVDADGLDAERLLKRSNSRSRRQLGSRVSSRKPAKEKRAAGTRGSR